MKLGGQMNVKNVNLNAILAAPAKQQASKQSKPAVSLNSAPKAVKLNKQA